MKILQYTVNGAIACVSAFIFFIGLGLYYEYLNLVDLGLWLNRGFFSLLILFSLVFFTNGHYRKVYRKYQIPFVLIYLTIGFLEGATLISLILSGDMDLNWKVALVGVFIGFSLNQFFIYLHIWKTKLKSRWRIQKMIYSAQA